MGKKMEQFLKGIGFTYMTGSLWKHPKIGIMHFQIGEATTKESIMISIWKRGYDECQSNIQNALGIVPPRI